MVKPPRELLYKYSNKTSIFKIFGGKSRSQVRCMGCNHKSNTYEDFISVSLDLPSMGDSTSGYTVTMSLEQCLSKFCKSECLTGENCYVCSHCKRRCEAKKSFSIEQSPRILIVHLKRFTNFGTKISSFIRYPKVLSLKNYMSSCIDQSKPLMGHASNEEAYDLYGIVVHQGSGCRSGHYYSYVRGIDDNWYNCNDEFVTRMSGGVDSVLSQQAYILFYQKRLSPPKRSH